MISVVVLCYNSWDKCERLLDSLPLHKRDVEWIVVDNGSFDEWQNLDRYPVIYYRVKPNRGVPGGFNAGIRQVTGDHIVLLACDTLCQSDEFPENMVRGGKVVTGPYLRSNPGGIPVVYLDGWCYSFPRTLVDDIGELDEFYYYCWEDVDFSIRAQEAGYALEQINCGIINPTPPRYEDIPMYYGRNMEYLKRKFDL